MSETENLINMCQGLMLADGIPCVGPRSLNLFVVSAYSDFQLERKFLQEQAYPQLREYCKRNFGLQFEVVDLKLGLENIIEEDFDYQKLFLVERERYCQATLGCCPLILLGQKYGLPLLPKRIPSDVYDLIRATLRAHRNSFTRRYAVLDSWYRRDENTNDEPEHVLVNIGEHFPDLTSQDVEAKCLAKKELEETRQLLSTLLKIGFAFCLREGTLDEKMVQQILVYELDSAISSVINKSHETGLSPLIFQREIIDIKNYFDAKKATNFADLEASENPEILQPDTFLVDLLKELYDRLFAYHAPSNEPFSVLWRFETGIERKLHQEYLNDFCESFIQSAKFAINVRAAKKTMHQEPLCIQVYDDVWTAMTHSRKLAVFSAGHEEATDAMLTYIQDASLDAPMVLYGPSNAGKAPVIARCFFEIEYLLEDKSALFLITRVILYPTTLQSLVESLSKQVNLHKALTTEEPPEEPVSDLRTFLGGLSKRYKFIILISGTEKLVTLDNEPCDIVSLLPENLNENVKIVVTSTESREGLPNGFLKLPLREFESSDYQAFLYAFINFHGRTLTQEQSGAVQAYISSVSNMLQASIVADQLCKIRSFDVLDPKTLPKTTEECINGIFESLEVKYGSFVISHVACFISASDDGITDQEIEDLLSLSNEVMESFEMGDSVDVKRFPIVIWLLIKEDIQTLLMQFSKDGFFLNYWASSKIETITQERYHDSEQKRLGYHYLMADYFLGVWHDSPKPYGNDAEMPHSADRLVPSQDTMYKTPETTFFNVRQYRQLPRHLLLSGRLEELYKLALFSYDWIFYKTKALGIDEILKDYEIVEQNMEVNLVEETIRKAGPYIEDNMENMAAELVGQLLPYSYIYKNIKSLVKQCDECGPVHNGFLPTYPYPKLPGSALQSTVVCPTALRSIHLMSKEGILMVKLENDPKLYQYNLNKGTITDETILSHGETFISQNSKYAIVLDDKYRNTLKVHHVMDGTFLGQIIPLNWIESRPFEEKHKFKITHLDIGEEEIAIVLSNEVSYVFIVSLKTCKPIHEFRPEKRATLCKLSTDGQFLYTNSAEQLLGFSAVTGEQIAAVDLLAKPIKMVFTRDISKAFILCDEELRVVVLHLQDGYVQTSYKIVFENSLNDDHVTDIKLSTKGELLLIRGEKNILVYDFARDAIISHLKRPSEIPEDFKLPNSVYTTLNFTEADFAFDDKVVVTSIFRDVLIWSIADSCPLAMLHAPVGIITKLVVDRDRKGLIGYIGHSREIHLWNLNGAFTDGTVIDALTESISKVCVAQEAPKAIAVCAKSDEMGVVDLETGFLTDLYTHEGHVLKCAISSCGAFALVGIRVRKPNTSNIVWSLNTRRILKEFGNTTGHLIPYKQRSDIIHLVQSGPSLTAPYEITVISCSEIEASIQETGVKIPYLLCEPFLTGNDDSLVTLSAHDYIDRKVYYVTPTIAVWKSGSNELQTIGPDTLCNFALVTRILDLKSANSMDSAVIVLYTSDDANTQSMDDHTEKYTSKSVLIFDIERLNVLTVINDIFPVDIDTRNLTFSSNGQLCMDKANNLYSMELSYCVGQMAPKEMKFHGFLLNNKAVLLSMGQYLFGFRIPESTLIGKVDIHENVTHVEIRKDERTIVVGCSSGNVLCYTLLDHLTDNIEKVLTSVKSRALLDRENSRNWDRLVQQEDGGNYSRPPSMAGNSAANRHLADVNFDDADADTDAVARPSSEPGMLTRTKTCVTM